MTIFSPIAADDGWYFHIFFFFFFHKNDISLWIISLKESFDEMSELLSGKKKNNYQK